MVRLEGTTPAADQLQHAQDYYDALNPRAAHVMAVRILESARRLREQPAIGRPGRITGTREWTVDRTPYLLVYRVQDGAVQVLHVWHEAQDRRIVEDRNHIGR